jgi:hypothetical protein
MPVRRPLIGICHRPNRARYLRRTPVCPYLSNGLSVHWGATEKVACFAPTPSGSNDVSIILQIPSNGSAWSLPFHSSHMGRVKSKCLWRSRWVARQSHDRLKLMPFRSSSIEKGIFAVPISTMYSPSPGSVTGVVQAGGTEQIAVRLFGGFAFELPNGQIATADGPAVKADDHRTALPDRASLIGTSYAAPDLG